MGLDDLAPLQVDALDDVGRPGMPSDAPAVLMTVVSRITIQYGTCLWKVGCVRAPILLILRLIPTSCFLRQLIACLPSASPGLRRCLSI